ncbi:MAG: ribonuclease III, partial [Planctomycetota bacterium]
FLGDSVLSLVISHYIFDQLTEYNEGQLSRVRASLVKEQTLAHIARDIELGNYIKLGGGELKSGGFRRASILSDTLEAIIGAIYLDSNFEQARKTVLYLYQNYLNNLPDALSLKDPKTRLQEALQARQIDLPNYEVVQTAGKDHDRVFTVKCSLSELSIEATGKGSSRKKAEQIAADNVLKQL